MRTGRRTAGLPDRDGGISVSEVARQAGIAASAVRWYESEGVIPLAGRKDNGYRDYTDEDAARLRLVVSLRRLGLSPGDAGRLAQQCLDHRTPDVELAAALAEQRAAIARKRADLERLEGELADLEFTLTAADRVRRRKEGDTVVEARPVRVLFVCTGNSARSQIAEALLTAMGGPDFEVASAGTHPKGVNPFAIRVLAEADIDWGHARSKIVTEFVDQRFDYVITVCDRARETCPVFPGSVNTLHWGLDDPAEVEGTDEEKLEAFRTTRRELALRLRPFIEIARRAAGSRATLAGQR